MATKNSNFDNPAFTTSPADIEATTLPAINGLSASDNQTSDPTSIDDAATTKPVRETWGNGIEFLMSCIAMSVGLGNVWRFPFIALENGGGAFLIPYIIVLILVGRPIYYLEMILGQFSSRGGLNVFDLAPIMRGIGYGQAFCLFLICTYYASLMALTLRYLIASFYAILPWSYCREEWGPLCIDSKLQEEDTTWPVRETSGEIKKTSAEYYFINFVLREKPNIDDGIGAPNWTLALTLAFAWIVIGSIVIRGIKSSGKAAYFLALFPYVIMLVLLVRALTLPGSAAGVLYFLTPQWDKLLDAKVWYAAVTQVFFSLSVCYGAIVMYSSFNRFDHNIIRDSVIVTTLDTFTSLLSGITIFGILGNLAHETGTSDIRTVVQGGPGLAFISYPDAIAKFGKVPQLFSALFFLMLLVLGVGSNAGAVSGVITVLHERFTSLKRWWIVVGTAVACYCFGLMYVTPGGQFMLNFIDFYGVTFVTLVLAIFELITAGWIYGVKNLCRDIKFMLNRTTSLYYRLCWGIISPIFMAAVFVFMLVEYEPLEYNGAKYPQYLYGIGWCISAIGIGQLFIWGFLAVSKRPEVSFKDRFFNACKPLPQWGPLNPSTFKIYKQTIDDLNNASAVKTGFWFKVYDNIFN